MLTSLPFELNSNFHQSIKCPIHQTQQAITYCSECKCYLCLDPSCGRAHIYHEIENIGTLINKKLIPVLNSLFTINKEHSSTSVYVKALNVIKNNLKQYTFHEKQKIDNQYRELTKTLKSIYSGYLSQVDIFMNEINNKLNYLLINVLNRSFYPSNYEDSFKEEKIQKSLYNINMELKDAIDKSNGNPCDFINQIISKIKPFKLTIEEYNTKIKSNSFSNENIEKSIDHLREYSKKKYNEIQIDGDKYFSNLNEKLKVKIIEVEDKNKKIKEKLSMENPLKISSPQIIYTKIKIMDKTLFNSDIDLDIFARDLHKAINSYRINPSSLINSIFTSSYSKANSIFQTIKKNKVDYIQSYLSKLKPRKSELEWDNDLSNSAEDFFKENDNKMKKATEINKAIKEILIQSYYSEKDYLDQIRTIGFDKEKPVIEEIIENILFTEDNWDFAKGENIFFSNDYNLIGISVVPYSAMANKVNIIINLGAFKHKS